MSLKLERLQGFEGARPVVLVIMDGVGIGKYVEGDYVRSASMPTLAWLKEHGVYTQLKAHGRAVGMPSDADMGNSEIGHNAIGCGRVYDQGAALVGKAVESGSMFEGKTWQELVANVKGKGTTLHFIGLLSDGNVHSHLDHLKGMLQQAAKEGVKRVRIHALIDGRDVPPTSALDYVRPFEAFLAELNGKAGVDYAIASGGGRMNITMDRYEANWDMVARGWACHVRGEGRQFASAEAAIETYRAEIPGVLDQDLPAFIVAKDGQPLGPIG
ncbi:MAG: 2,3-bisphosphoglycerate-independent phosphoglycerate mutase, partial [Kiritimatiellae bacterium]|nr:2,3-bisphosphoglycerate-independent phosphoglycerate mutase [Kiritimatiellia bacterium]